MGEQKKQSEIEKAVCEITKVDISRCIACFDESERLKEAVLRKAFSNKENRNLEEVLMKVTLLNAFYSTQLFNNPGKNGQKRKNADIQTMAKHIVNLAVNSELDEKMAKGDPEAVKLIRQIDPSRYSAASSFATKYCSWHNPECFPIMDRYSKGMLYYLCRADNGLFKDFYRYPIKKAELKDYESFCTIHRALRAYIMEKVGMFSCKDTDKFLWGYGVQNGIAID